MLQDLSRRGMNWRQPRLHPTEYISRVACHPRAIGTSYRHELLGGSETIHGEPGLPLLGCPLRARCGVGRDRGADELPEGRFVDLFPFAEVDRAPHIAFQTGIE